MNWFQEYLKMKARHDEVLEKSWDVISGLSRENDRLEMNMIKLTIYAPNTGRRIEVKLPAVPRVGDSVNFRSNVDPDAIYGEVKRVLWCGSEDGEYGPTVDVVVA